jgi:hydrogenase maturation protease
MTTGIRIALIGYGHLARGDDGAGLLVVRRLRGMLPLEVEIREVLGDGAALMETWSGCDRVVVVDAVYSGAPVGTLHRLDARRLVDLEEFRSTSSHTLGLREAIRLAQVLGRLPRQIEILGIEGRRFGAGDALSPEVRQGIERAVALLLESLPDTGSSGGTGEKKANRPAETGTSPRNAVQGRN